jgi:hypothetical protein
VTVIVFSFVISRYKYFNNTQLFCMKQLKWTFLICLLANCFAANAQALIDSVQFFTDDQLIEMTLTTDIRQLQTEKKDEAYQPGSVECRFADSSVIKEDIRLYARGKFRRENCTIPPIMLNFHNPTSPKLNQLGKLKLVIGCGSRSEDEQLILKEYLCYKIYNLLEEKSFRVRLLKVNYRDSKGKMKPFTQYAFLLEDDSELARRNNCVKGEEKIAHTESTQRSTMTMVAAFEYMISNGDWSVPVGHNIKLIYEKKSERLVPYPVPYDFDHSGFVNAGYALPNELLGTEKVTERAYRGFPRTMEELQTTFEIFKKQKENIYSVIRNFTLLKERTRNEAIEYLEGFYRTINDRREVQSVFIDNARTN